ncbi:hypothetical protein SeLEV6574_g05535 [Synchytrium endobioticum]|uniref:Peroxisome assembly protein 12 n=1 Tax=Synchytrium endobioticum TaxID=286115 RepID=A0A507CTP1_9FUNG|nr:hypothetical protein SeLEV6574_g05542 [Synchytrium endobioticum]TPX42553.1 hypothetical protein SeLEV6574_g05535 [Synchytrium endobioticum]
MEYLSNLGAISGDLYRPSYFELVNQDKMTDMLRPALRYVLTVYAQRYPRYLLRMVNHHDELYALLMLIVENHYLREWGASFAENFYGLKRVPARTAFRGRGALEGLSEYHIYSSLLFMVGLPYIKGKLDQCYEALSGGPGGHLFGNVFEDDEESTPQTPREFMPNFLKKAKQAFRTTYPYTDGVYNAVLFAYQLAYMFNRTDYFSPWLHLCRVQVRRMSPRDFKAHAEKEDLARKALSSALSSGSPRQLAKYIFTLTITRGFDFLKYLLPMSVFFFKFLEWWYHSGFHKQASAQPIPPPPDSVPPHSEGLSIPSDNSTCPLCQKKRTNPTMIPSGFVFCYPCIFRYVEDNQRCPVTFMGTVTEQLRKVYAVSP